MQDRLKRCVEESPVVHFGDYEYFVSPITDGIPCMDPEVLREVVERIIEVADLECDYIVAPEAMGIPLAVPLSLRTGIPYNVVRKRRYGLPGEVSVAQVTGYSKCQMFINGLKRGDRVVLLDDVVSTGGTLTAIAKALTSMGVNIVDVVVVIEKGAGKQEVEREIGQSIKALVKADIIDGRVIASDPTDP